ncbi:MAG: hypothetical protein ACRD2X_12990 [Vicinamibacteraceae bacterium]
MTLLHRLRSVLRWLVRRDRAEQDLNDELQAFIDMAPRTGCGTVRRQPRHGASPYFISAAWNRQGNVSDLVVMAPGLTTSEETCGMAFGCAPGVRASPPSSS